MRVVNAAVGGTARALLLRPTEYDKMRQTLREEKRCGHPLLVRSKRRKKLADDWLATGISDKGRSWWVKANAGRWLVNRFFYQYQCSCGKLITLSAREIMSRHNAGLGCCLPGCNVTSPRHTVWTDPDFDPKQRAFYYVRVLEIPTPRWSLYDAVRFDVQHPEGAPTSTQERAYTSPIWYTP